MKLPSPEIPVLKSHPRGNDSAAIFPGGLLTLTYWDLWCLLAAKHKFNANLTALKASLVDKRLNDRLYSLHGRDFVEDLIALTTDLEGRIQPVGSVDAILTEIPERLIKKESQKAVRQFLDSSSTSHPLSEPMLRSPRRLLEKEAMRGMWGQLPVDPTSIAKSLYPLFIPNRKPGYFTKSATFALTRRIEKAIDKELAKAGEIFTTNHKAYGYAVYRAALTLYHEENSWDDSFGEMGGLGQGWVKEILTISAADVGADPRVFLKDLLMFFCWEDYGLSDTNQAIRYVNNQASVERELAIGILVDIHARATEGFQNYHADAAARILKGIGVEAPTRPLGPRRLMALSGGPADRA